MQTTVPPLTWKSFFEDELVGKQQGEVCREGLGPDVKAQETYREVDGAFAGEPDARTRDGVDVYLYLNPHRLGHPEYSLLFTEVCQIAA